MDGEIRLRRYTDDERQVFLTQIAYAIDDFVNGNKKRYTFIPRNLIDFCGLSPQLVSHYLVKYFVDSDLIGVYGCNSDTNRYFVRDFDLVKSLDFFMNNHVKER